MMRRHPWQVFLLLVFAGCGRTALDAANGGGVRDAARVDAADSGLGGSTGGTGGIRTTMGGNGGLIGGAGGTGGAHTGTSSDPSCTPELFTPDGLPVSLFSDPRFIAIGDLDADGNPDLLATLANAEKVAIVLGRGDGSFSRTVEIDAGSNPGAAVIGDLNGDGKNDMVVANAETVSVLLSKGGGIFATRVEYPVEKNPDHLVLGDVNGDGHRDIAMTNGNLSLVSLLLNHGDGTFAAASSHTLGGQPYALAVGDLNGDGRADLAVALETSEAVTLLFGTRDGTFTSQTIRGSANSLVIGEFDGDGRPDLALSTGRAVRVLLNQGGGTFSAAVEYAAGPVDACPGYALTIGDTNKDGRADLALLNDDCGVITVLRNRGDGTFADAEVSSLAFDNYPGLLTFGDLTGDQRDDLVFLSIRHVSILPAQPDGGFPREWDPSTPLTAPYALGDVDGDGRLDFVRGLANDRMIEVRVGQPDGSFAAGSRYPIKSELSRLAVADLSGDGRSDIVYWAFGHPMGVLLRQGDGSFGSPVENNLPAYPDACVFRDLNSDGDADALLISSSSMSMTVDVLLSQGDGTLVRTTSYTPGNLPEIMAVGDFNADGKLDLAYASPKSREVGIAPGQGDGTFAAGMRHTTTGTPYSLATGDLNGDNVTDLVVTSCSPNIVSVFLGGAGLQGTWRDTPVDFNAEEVLGIGDVNLDGRADLAVVQGGSMLFIMLGRGDGTFAESLAYGMVYGGPMVLADLTGDGRLDVGVIEEVDGVVKWNVYRNSLCQ